MCGECSLPPLSMVVVWAGAPAMEPHSGPRLHLLWNSLGGVCLVGQEGLHATRAFNGHNNVVAVSFHTYIHTYLHYPSQDTWDLVGAAGDPCPTLHPVHPRGMRQRGWTWLLLGWVCVRSRPLPSVCPPLPCPPNLRPVPLHLAPNLVWSQVVSHSNFKVKCGAHCVEEGRSGGRSRPASCPLIFAGSHCCAIPTEYWLLGLSKKQLHPVQKPSGPWLSWSCLS